ncbi:MAG TPA: FdtA/QdtA family cupin domain-containing protein [Candidatus Ozemobacteraceae bacterium]|nr:FdtA/QdtA family cupin domain-containing protein [Candidatus Ozemobacteraceae bacterium]
MKTFANSRVFDCPVLALPVVHNPAGNISYANSRENIPFEIKRVYYLYDVPAGETRGGHAHRQLYELLFAAQGSYDVVLDDGNCKSIIHLNRPHLGLLIVPGIWRELINFSSGAISLVLASEVYDESDYIREYDQFIREKKPEQP